MNWREERSRTAAEHAAALERARETEIAAARAIIDDFLVAARAAKLPTTRFVVQGFGGKGQARTNVEGWLLRRNGTIGLGTDGTVYRLTDDLSLLDRIRGVEPRPIDPQRQIGAGGRDGDSIMLEDALRRLLPEWRS